MKAAAYDQYGAPEVLKIRDIEKPVPKVDEILVRIRATAVNSGDWRLRRADPWAVRLFFGLLKPKIKVLGSVFSGEVERIGDAVTEFKVGDHVFGHTDMQFGAYAEYIAVPAASSVTSSPAGFTHEAAAVVPFGGVTALHFLKKAAVQPGQKILIIGASGAVGSAAVQLAKAMGATVTAVCSTANTALVQSLGADEVIDYTKEDLYSRGTMYDIIFDAVNTISAKKATSLLRKNGTMILSAAGGAQMMQAMRINATKRFKVLTGVIQHAKEDIIYLRKLMEAGKYQPVIDTTYTLEEMAEAHRYVEKGHKKGNVAIRV